MDDPLPTPILQLVQNNGASFLITWRYLGDNLQCRVGLYDATGTQVQYVDSDPDVTFVDMIPNGSLDNPPYMIGAAAFAGANIGPYCTPVPLVLYVPTVKEQTYDTTDAGVFLKSPPDPVSYDYTLLLFKDGVNIANQSFQGLRGSVALSAPSTTSYYSAAVMASLDTSEGQYSCTSIGPRSVQLGIITTPPTLTRVQYESSPPQFKVSANPPTSTGPPIKGIIARIIEEEADDALLESVKRRVAA